MNRMILAALLIGIAIWAGSAIVAARPALCVWCPTYKCFGRCSRDCACISGPGETSGYCYGVQWVDDLPEGWSVLEEAR